MKILVFGMIAEQIGKNEIWIENPENTEILKQKLFQNYPFLTEIKFSVVIDRKIIHQKTDLLPHQEIALLPPFSGG